MDTGQREMAENNYAVIMAGGGGTRLWPLSRQARPKQLLRLIGGRSFFQIAVDRLAGLIPPERILVVTTADQAALLTQETPQIPASNFILEPMPRGTASVVGLAALAIHHLDPQAGMIVLTADHVIKNVLHFQHLLILGMQVARQDYLVTLGIEPTFPSTGYGYIQAGEWIPGFGTERVFRALKFKEKPNVETAQAFLASGNHYWNSGMFIWQVERILEEFQHWMPAHFEAFTQIGMRWGTPRQEQVLQEIWPTIPTQTIDFGIMEKAEKVAVLPAIDLGWSDVGSWESLFEILPANDNGNIILSEPVIEINASENLVISETNKRLVALVGVEDLVVVDTPDALLVCKREDAQQVRAVVAQLKQNGNSEYL